MAKKKTVGPDAPAAPRAATPRRGATTTPAGSSARRRATAPRPAPVTAETGAAPPAEPLDLAAEAGANSGEARPSQGSSQGPSHEEIAEAAYRRYLARGGRDGRDFDDWLEAERALRARR
jgi:hypothetical protein